MEESEIWAQLNDVFRKFFKNSEIVLSPQTTAADIAEWDSLNHVQLLVAIESHFKVRMKHAEIASFENVGDLVKALDRHTKAKS